MTDLFLKFESADQAKPLLYDVTVEHRDENGLTVQPTIDPETHDEVYPDGTIEVEVLHQKFRNTDVIGDIWKPTGETIQQEGPGGEMMDVPVMEKLPGYHVNIRLVADEDATELQPFAIVPTNPVRVWA